MSATELYAIRWRSAARGRQTREGCGKQAIIWL